MFVECCRIVGLQCLQYLDMGYALLVCVSCIGGWGHHNIATSTALTTCDKQCLPRETKLYYLKNKTFKYPAVLMETAPATTGTAAEEARAECERVTVSESDRESDSASCSALDSAWKRHNLWNLVFEKFGFGKADETIKALKESWHLPWHLCKGKSFTWQFFWYIYVFTVSTTTTTIYSPSPCEGTKQVLPK